MANESRMDKSIKKCMTKIHANLWYGNQIRRIKCIQAHMNILELDMGVWLSFSTSVLLEIAKDQYKARIKELEAQERSKGQ